MDVLEFVVTAALCFGGGWAIGYLGTRAINYFRNKSYDG